MSRIKYVIIAAPAALLFAACSTSPSTTTPPPKASAVVAPAATTPAASAPAATSSAATTGALSGTWNGQYSGSYTGTFTLHWQQNNSTLTGTINLSTAGTLPIHGTVSGGSIQFGTVGSTQITYSGSVSGNSMSGNYQVASTNGSQNGSWSASRA